MSLNKPKLNLTTTLKSLFAVEWHETVSSGKYERFEEDAVMAPFLVFCIWTEFFRFLCILPCNFFYRLPLYLFSPKQK
jgi:hypothetical protein